jgi:Effector-associated domain 2/Effector-associated domain 1
VQLRDEIEERIVDALDSALSLASERSRHLLLGKIEAVLDRPVRVADYSQRRQWFTALVMACREQPGGIRALGAAVNALERGSPTADRVQRGCSSWECVHGQEVDVQVQPPSASENDCTPLTAKECVALASAFPSTLGARQLLVDAGLPVQRHPRIDRHTSIEFWNEVNYLVANGALREGRRRILAEAARRLPFNPVFIRPGAS